MENFKTDLIFQEIFVFTPEGKVISLPIGSTPVDFAFRIHTDVGYRCEGARVNKKMVTLDHILETGNIVEIITSKDRYETTIIGKTNNDLITLDNNLIPINDIIDIYEK